MAKTSVDICVCTFRRLQVADTIQSLLDMDYPQELKVRILVIDNDDSDFALSIVEPFMSGHETAVQYVHAPGRNISIARNAALNASNAEHLAFIDDDETAEIGWLSGLWETLESSNSDVVFGCVKSVFPANAPDWIKELDLHAPSTPRRNGKVETGSARSVLMKWRGMPWFDERFDLGRGKSGGEDTDFFFRIGQLGAKMETSEASLALEPVAPDRNNLSWLIQRRFRSGQSHASTTTGTVGRIGLGIKAVAKAIFCLPIACVNFGSAYKWRYWFLRGVFHSGVLAGCFNVRQKISYGLDK